MWREMIGEVRENRLALAGEKKETKNIVLLNLIFQFLVPEVVFGS